MTDDRDGRTYKITTIGNQIWMAENLNFEMENSCCYNDIESYCSKYGRLYTWENAKKACPSGWHLPTKTEFETLISTIEGNQYTKGKGLKSTSGWNGGAMVWIPIHLRHCLPVESMIRMVVSSMMREIMRIFGALLILVVWRLLWYCPMTMIM